MAEVAPAKPKPTQVQAMLQPFSCPIAARTMVCLRNHAVLVLCNGKPSLLRWLGAHQAQEDASSLAVALAEKEGALAAAEAEAADARADSDRLVQVTGVGVHHAKSMVQCCWVRFV